ncbi:MAG: glucosyl-3-phosphoglycerate synthase [Luteolibacter sp.]
MQRFHHTEFADLPHLLSLKGTQKISVCIPTLNEAENIGSIVSSIHDVLMQKITFIDELIVMDSGSTDLTREIAASAGANVMLSSEISPKLPTHPGKGENLWKSLMVSSGDIVCYLDGDVSNFHTGFVTGLVGPLLQDASIDYVKGFYQRPLLNGDHHESSGGGRVSEILVRPLISMFYPELADIIQPLAGEYAARRSTFESLSFPTGYGVEIAHLIDLMNDGKLSRIAQTNLETRIHRNRSDSELSDTAFAILKVITRRLQRDGHISADISLTDLHQQWNITNDSIALTSKFIPEPELPAINQNR